MKKNITVRFAPSPTGFMHLGNVRAALMNFLFAKKNHGTLILRVEDTDQERHLEEAVDRITQDLTWLGINIDKGPYFQSQRQKLYQEQLEDMIKHNLVYRCFCSKETLDEMREKQKLAGKPPRYDRRCAIYSQDRIQRKLDHGLPFIWRFKLDDQHVIELQDIAKGNISFDLSHFSDFAITRENGSFTFLFTNFIDDALMNITHVIRGEDHLSNTALQLAMYHATARSAPIYWHLPLLCNDQGEKMSKRDFGFNLNDLKEAGFLPEAICNYLAILGKSFSQEIQSLDELIQHYDFTNVSNAATIRYDKEKLEWVNQEWIQRLNPQELYQRIHTQLECQYPSSKKYSPKNIAELINIVRPGLKSLNELTTACSFYFINPSKTYEDLSLQLSADESKKIYNLIEQSFTQDHNPLEALCKIKQQSKTQHIQTKVLLTSMRMALTGVERGIGIQELFTLLSRDTLLQRFRAFFLNPASPTSLE